MKETIDNFLECALIMHELNNLNPDDIEYEKVYCQFAELFSKLNDREKEFLREEYNLSDKLFDDEINHKEEKINYTQR